MAVLFEKTAYALRHKRTGRLATTGVYQPFIQWVRPEDRDDPGGDFETVRVVVSITEKKKRASPKSRKRSER